MSKFIDAVYQCVSNWRFWVALFIWLPLVLPFVIFEAILEFLEWFFEQASLKIRKLNRAMNKAFYRFPINQSIPEWVNENRKDRKCKKPAQ